MAVLNQHSWEKNDLSGQNLKSLPQDFVTHVSLCTSLDLQRNKLKHVIGISNFINLTELNLSRNKIIKFPLEMHNMHKLETLYMNQNKIRSIPEGIFPHLRNLKFLKLGTNRLAKLPSDINQCLSIIYLNLSKNHLQDIQPLVGLPKLEELWVERNQLSDLPAQLFRKDSCELTVFQAAGNPLKCPPEEVCAGGVMDIQSYFLQMEENPNTHTAWTVKVMFLGSSMAGKSTLCRSLREGKPVAVAVKDRTEGIDISQMYTKGVRFLFWDFAGQEEYYLTHHVFITPRALVILTIDLASIEDPHSFKDQLWFWINNIQLRVPDALVMLVGTHCDQCRDLDEVMAKKTYIEEKVKSMLEYRRMVLKQQKKNLEDNKDSSLYMDQMDELDCLLDYSLKVLDLVPLDCTRNEDIAKLRSHVLDCIQSENASLGFESILPRSYEEVEQAIPKLIAQEEIPKHGIILFEEIVDLISNHVTQSREHLNSILSVLLRYLHRIGTIIWYEDISALSDRVFIQPSFLISMFKSTVRNDLVQQLEGISRDLLMQEGALVKQKFTWLDDLRCRGMLHNAAMRILVRREVEKLVDDDDDDDLIREIVGTKREEGIILTLLQYFEVCLPTLVRNPMNPEAAEFIPGKKKWETAREAKRDPDGACLFPMYLKNNLIVDHKWGEDRQDDITVHVYFLPEIPHGFFHRIIIKTCSLYPTHWVGKEQCLLCCGNRLALVRQRNKDGDSFIEIRCRRPEKNEEFQQVWDLILAVMSKLFVLSRQWPGLTHQVHTPCPERGCPHYYTWKDWQDLHNTDFYSFVKEEKIVCQGGHTRRTELIFPKDK
ncbi:malignant fibrous histiocytoma-amplified sequence 1 isoform X2 [Melanotaenia boesemani]|uniref:malignant fibrous histiocytoma-amplified sequence 1 isoform X2 n=1 Tax=Melanotaenia boesemani TaxID=1250792 RepID=UPI001C05A8F4|nr:malignant fibrous histiocytoma-amplified sequence 1 isoform X2 [Melanotaenia boesemani]